MKITKTPDDIKLKELSRKKANEGCSKCPTCGNTKIVDLIDDVKRSENDTIVRMTFSCTKTSFFKYQSGNIDKYECKTCGTEWESEIY